MQSPCPILLAPFAIAAALCWAQNPAEDGPKPVRERNWSQILGPSQGRWPTPRPALTWFTNLEQAQAMAAREGRPLFVVLRCLPCKQCADFDAAVLEGGPILTPLLQQFVTVRLTNAQSLDLRQFPMQSMQDLDLSWWGWFLSPQGSIYGVFGGKDEKGDSSRISVNALAATLKRVLDHHFDPRHADWEVDVKPLRGDKPVTALDLPGFASWGRRFVQDNPIECIHCHQVAEILRQPAIDAKTFDKQRDLQIWPYPENIGIQVLRDDGLLVAKVSEGSPAAAAGIEVGDRIASAINRKLFSEADLRTVMQRISVNGGALELRWLRKGKLMQAILQLKPGWKRVELGWRQSVAGGNIGAHPGFAWPNAIKDEEKKKLGINPDRMAIRAYFGKDQAGWIARNAGLSISDVIVAVNGKSPNVSGRDFMSLFRLAFEPGDEVTLHVRDNKGRERDVKYKATANGR